MSDSHTTRLSGNEVIDTEVKLFSVLTEAGESFAEHELLREPDLVLHMEWIIWAANVWAVRLPKMLSEMGFEGDAADEKRAVLHFMEAAIRRLREMTGKGQSTRLISA